MDTIVLGERTFKVETIHDEQMGEPWKEHDGHGIVSKWTRRSKIPGERVLCLDHGNYRYYDVSATMKLARKDGWNIDDETKAALAERLRREPTRGDILTEAVNRDYHHLLGWCNGNWHWVCLTVTLLDEDGKETDQAESIGGIESDTGDYLKEVAKQLAEDILARVERESFERDYWEARDVQTV